MNAGESALPGCTLQQSQPPRPLGRQEGDGSCPPGPKQPLSVDRALLCKEMGEEHST